MHKSWSITKVGKSGKNKPKSSMLHTVANIRSMVSIILDGIKTESRRTVKSEHIERADTSLGSYLVTGNISQCMFVITCKC